MVNDQTTRIMSSLIITWKENMTHIILVYYSENDIKDIDNRCLHGHTRVYTVSLFVIKIFSVVCNTEM